MSNNLVLKFFIFATFIASLLEYQDNAFVGVSYQYSPPLTFIELVITTDLDGKEWTKESSFSQRPSTKFQSIKRPLSNRYLFKIFYFSQPGFLELKSYEAGRYIISFLRKQTTCHQSSDNDVPPIRIFPISWWVANVRVSSAFQAQILFKDPLTLWSVTPFT